MTTVKMSLEVLLNSALLEAQARELAALPDKTELDRRYAATPMLDKRLERLAEKKHRKETGKRAMRLIKKLAVSTAAMLALVTCVFAPVQAVRQAAVNTVLEWRAQYTRFTFSSSDTTAKALPETIILGFIPQGYVLSQLLKDSEGYSATYFFGKDKHISVDIALLLPDEAVIGVDNEQSNYYTLRFDNHDACWIVHADGSNTLIWTQGDYLFDITVSEAVNIAIEVAENIIME